MSLENRYRRLLRAYPREYRERRGDEMVATLLEGAAPGQQRPSRRDVLDLLGGAARERLGLHAVPGFAAGLRIAWPIAFVVVAASAVSEWIAGDRYPGSTAVAAAWLAATVVLAVRPARLPAVLAVGLAWVVTVGVGIAAQLRPITITLPDNGYGTVFHHGWYASAMFWGLIALIAAWAAPTPPRAVTRFAVPAAIAALAGVAVAVDGVFSAAEPQLLPHPQWMAYQWLIPVAAFALGVVDAAWRRETEWLWAALILLVPVPLSLVWSGQLRAGWQPPIGQRILDLVPAGAGAMFNVGLVAAAVWLATRATSPGGFGVADNRQIPRGALAGAGAVCLGLAGGLAASLAIAGWSMRELSGTAVAVLAAIVAALVLAPMAPAWLTRAVVALAMIAVAVAEYRQVFPAIVEPFLSGVFVLLLAVPAATVQRKSWTAPWVALATVLANAAIALLFFQSVPDVLLVAAFAPWVATVGLAPTIYYAARVLVGRNASWVGASVAFASALLWLLLLLGPSRSSVVIGASVGAALLALLGVRLARLRWPGAAPAGTA